MIPDKFLLQIFKSSNLPAIILLPDAPFFTIVEVNELYLNNSKRRESDLIGKSIFDVSANYDGNRDGDVNSDLKQSLSEVLKTKAPDKICNWKYDIYNVVTEKFEEKYWDIENTPLLNDDSEIEYIVQIVQDVTHAVLLKKTRKLLASRGRKELTDLGFKSLIQHGINLISVFDDEGKYTYASPTFYSILGIDPVSLIGNRASMFIHPEDIDHVMSCFATLSEAKKVIIPPFRFRHANGTWRWLETIVSDLLDDPEVNGIVSNSRDVTQRVTAEKELKNSEEKYRSLFRLSPVPKWIYDLNTLQILDVNEAAVTHYGYCREEFCRMSVRDLSPQKAFPLMHVDEKINGSDDAVYFGMFVHSKKDQTKINVEVWGHRFDFNRLKSMMVVCIDVTEKEDARRQLQEDRAKLLTAQKIARLGYWQLKPDDKSLYWSDEVYNIWGVNKETFVLSFKSFFQSIHPDHREAFWEAQATALSGEKDLNFEYRIILPDGSVKWVHERGKIAKNEEGKTILEGTCQDITVEKLLELSLEETNTRYRYVSKATSDAIWDWNFATNTIYWGEGFQFLFGYKLEDTQSDGDFWKNNIHPDDQDFILAEIEKAINSDTINWKMEYRFRRADNTFADILDKGFFIRDDNGKAGRMVGAMQDITQRKKADNQLREAYEERNNILESIGDIFFAVDKNWIVTYWNRMAENILGRCRDEIVGKNIWEEYEFGIGSVFYLNFKKALQQKTARYFEVTMHPINTSFEVSVFPSINGLSIYFKDVTERKQAIEKLRVSNERFERVAEAANDAIWDLDLIGNRLFLGKGFKKLRGDDYEEMLSGDKWLDHIHPKDRALIETTVKNALHDKSISLIEGECRYLTQSGDYIYIMARASVIRDEKGKINRLVGAFSDMTQRKAYEASLQALNANLEKINRELVISNTELEQFAYIASHDLQEPLRMITSFLSQIEKKYSNLIDEKGKQYIHFAVDGATRMRQIILDLLEFSRVGRLHDSNAEKIDFNQLINEIRSLYQKQIEETNAQIIIQKPLPEIATFKGPLRQVFQNLISNSLKYHKKDQPPLITISSTETATHWQFSVADDGLGIDAEYHDRIFVIFQRLHNKDDYSGTGIGLAIVKKIVENLGGEIWIKSSEGNGSIFFFTIKK